MASNSKNWSEQYRYMKRMHDRAIKALVSIPDDVHEAEDTLHAYFQAAWSFKDWLYSDESTNLKTKTVNDFANTDYLKIVGDIATWKKHLLVNDKNDQIVIWVSAESMSTKMITAIYLSNKILRLHSMVKKLALMPKN